MSALSKTELSTIGRAFLQILDRPCWALSNKKTPWDYDRGLGLVWSDPDLLVTFWQAVDLLHEPRCHGAGLGLFLGVNNRVACLDLDGTLNGQETPATETAAHIITGSGTFTEISLSGKGLHIFFEVDEGTEPFHLRRGITEKDGDFFTQKRFIRLTGRTYGKEYPVRYLPANQIEFIRAHYGKAPAAPVEIPQFNGVVSDRSLKARLNAGGIPYKLATITPQPFHADHGGILECIETLCPNVSQHTGPASPNAKFVRCADGLIAGRCFHGHCDPAVLRADGKSLAGLLSAKIRAAGDVTLVYTLLEKCESLGMQPLNGNKVHEMGFPAVVAQCNEFLKARGASC